MTRVYFLHIPKTAGMSMTALLKSKFGGRLCPAHLWDHIIDTGKSGLLDFEAFSGHFGVWLAEFIGADLATFTLLRDPLTRTVSHYRHVQRDPNHPLHPYVRGMSLHDYVVDPVTAPMTYNFQARYMARALAPWELRRRLRSEDLSRSRLAMTWENTSFSLSDLELEAQANQTFDSLHYVGVAERFDEAQEALATLFGLAARSIDRENVAPNAAPELDEATATLIRERTQIDARLHLRALNGSLANSRTSALAHA